MSQQLIVLSFGCIAAVGCNIFEEEACVRLCSRTTVRLSECEEQWPADWEDIGAENSDAFEQMCSDDWLELRAELEPRELQDALEQCDEGLKALRQARRSQDECNDLRALYLID